MAEDLPLSFEDLPDQAIGIILGKLESSKDKVRLTQASPSARRLTRGPNCEPGVMGKRLHVRISDEPSGVEKAAYFDLNFKDLDVILYPSHSDFPLALDYLAARSKAFTKAIIYRGNGRLESHTRLLDALYRQGACCPVTLTLYALGTSPSFSETLDRAQALVSHWLTVSEGIHSPRDRSLKIDSPPLDEEGARIFLAFLGRLKGIGGLKFCEPDGPSVPFPEFPHLTDCLERLTVHSKCQRTLPGFYPSLSSLKEINFWAFKSGECHDPRPYLRKLFESSAASLGSVTLTFGSRDNEPPFTMDLFEGLPKLKSLRLLPDADNKIRFPPLSDPYFQSDIVLPSLEELDIGSSSPLFFLSNLVLPRLRKLWISSDFDVQGTVDVGRIARFPSLEFVDVDMRITFWTQPGHFLGVSLGDLSGLTRLRELCIWSYADTGWIYTDSDYTLIMLRVQEGSSVLPPQMRGVAANEDVLASSRGIRQLVFKRAYTLHDD